MLWIMCFLSRTLEGCLSILNVLCLYASARRYRKGPIRIVSKTFKVVFLYWKLPCCCTLQFKAAGQFRFLFSRRESYLQMPNRVKGFSLETHTSPHRFSARSHLFKLYKMHFLSSHWGPLRRLLHLSGYLQIYLSSEALSFNSHLFAANV